MTLRERVLSTMKSTDTEGAFELYVTRTPGYLWALLFRALHVHPIAVTLMSIVIGCGSSYFFYQSTVEMNLIACGLLIWANWYDCADGQLARMTGQKTLIGRILDGFAGDAWFFCIYYALCLRLTPQWGPWIWLLAAWSGLRCHGRQCAIADYYRNVHLYFLLGGGGSELDNTGKQKQRLSELKWMSRDWFEKLYLSFYTIYTDSQEVQSPMFQRLKAELDAHHGGQLPTGLRERFLEGSRPLMKWCNVLTFDTRVAVLFASALMGHPWIYFVFESTVLEAIRFYTRRKHEHLCYEILSQL